MLLNSRYFSWRMRFKMYILVFFVHVLYLYDIMCILFLRYICEDIPEGKVKGTANSTCSANLLGSGRSRVKLTKTSVFVEHEYFSDF